MSFNTAYKIGAWCWIATGTGHTAADIAMILLPKSAPERAIEEVMRSQPFDFPGLQRNYNDMLNGLSFGVGLTVFSAGVLFLMLGRAAGQARTAALTGAVASVAMLINAAVLLPLPPIALFAAASLAFVIAFRASHISGLPTRTMGAGPQLETL
ncbi:LIC_13387 family protein [Nocardia rhamnosiphila]|uniref:Uncharacterized protein n=1 Tax=Nocardia rhamnosiphila TaxID=426716 RepID=A0ABV2WKA5_9NOCA